MKDVFRAVRASVWGGVQSAAADQQQTFNIGIESGHLKA
jgi:hypothetical protein